MSQAELFQNLLNFIEHGDEVGARAYLIEHLNEFPEDIKEKIAFAFFTEAAINTGEEMKAIADIQIEGKRILAELDEQEKNLDDAESAHAIKESIE